MPGFRFFAAALLLAGAMPAPIGRAQAPLARLPAGALVELRLDTGIDTRRTRTGDALAFTVVGSDCADGLRLRGGAEVTGRVVHAQKTGMFGKAAELLLSAGPWTPGTGPVVVRFRNLRAQAGRSRDAAAIGVAVVAGPFAAFVRGGHIVLPAGTPMAAETRETLELPADLFESCDAAPAQAEDAPSPVDPPVHHEPLQGELHEAHDVHPVDPGREPGLEPDRDGGRSAGDRAHDERGSGDRADDERGPDGDGRRPGGDD